jgi:UDP-N-acetylglucosamine 2-epimerase (non-hydrolysing)
MIRSKPILCVVGARPNFMKIGPVVRALEAQGFQAPLVHTGQHYDEAMNDRFFTDLGLPKPEINLEVGSGSHAQQTAEIMTRFEPVLDRADPAAVLVVGDVNSTIACALVAAKRLVPVVHVEAGLRSGDRTMPEEINRILTDQLSDFLFTTEATALGNLEREGIPADKVFFVGNVMIDTLLQNIPRAAPLPAGLPPEGGHVLVTLHRPSNVDTPETLAGLVDCLCRMARRLPVAFPVHPRTKGRLDAVGLTARLADAGIVLLPPQGYLEMLGLMKGARVVVTDSGGVQEETTALGVPCLTARENTERPITVEAGTNTIVGTDPAAIMAAFDWTLETGGKAGRVPDLWDGRAGVRIAKVLAEKLA